LDVAKTIYYRRRKGTVAILEEIAANITGWNAKAVEFFRRLGRTRHGLDPAIGLGYSPTDAVARLQQAEGLIGAATRTPIGGFADLRNAYGAHQAHTAFDEYFHTADVRVGQGRFGWHNIPHIGVFLWRLRSFLTGPVTPVPVAGCAGWYSFDPTGRDIPLFALPRAANQYGENWVSPTEGQLPAQISQELLNADLGAGTAGVGLYPSVLAVSRVVVNPPGNELLQPAELVLRPTRGRFEHLISPPQIETDLTATYSYGFPSEIGAGPYDRGAQPDTAFQTVSGGGTNITAIPSAGTVTLSDSLTYTDVPPVAVDGQLTLCAAPRQRPLLRLPEDTPWVITGAPQSDLALDGIFVSGTDVILRGSFRTVTLSCCTFDPGSAAAGTTLAPGGSPPAAPFALAVDGRELRPTRLWVEGMVTKLVADRCVLGPVRTRAGGVIESLKIGNSTIQGIRTSGFGLIEPDEVKDAARFLRLLQLGQDPVSALLRKLSPGIELLLGDLASPPSETSPPSEADLGQLLDLIDELVSGPSLYDAVSFARVPLSAETQSLLASAAAASPQPTLNRLLLEDAFPLELADAALTLADGEASLSRCTVLGRTVVHSLVASECILHDLAQVDDAQNGCIRFSAWAIGSILPRRYECVRIAPLAPLFTSTEFGQPAYAQLLATADAQVQLEPEATTAVQNTISAGAEDGSETGAYARDKNPIKERALLLKFQEYMPAGLVPVVVKVT
jgi:hypothetical protein